MNSVQFPNDLSTIFLQPFSSFYTSYDSPLPNPPQLLFGPWKGTSSMLPSLRISSLSTPSGTCWYPRPLQKHPWCFGITTEWSLEPKLWLPRSFLLGSSCASDCRHLCQAPKCTMGIRAWLNFLSAFCLSSSSDEILKLEIRPSVTTYFHEAMLLCMLTYPRVPLP